MRIPPIVSFLALRTALLVTVGAVLAVVGLRGFPLIALALVISSFISLPLLTRRRDAVSQRISDRVARTRERLDESSNGEDE